MQFRWNRDSLIEKYMDAPSTVLGSVGEPEPTDTQISNSLASAHFPRKRTRHSLSPPSPPSAARTCGVCYDMCDDDDPPSRCGHLFCKECWSTYLTGKIVSEGQCVIRCMGERCKTVVDETSLKVLVDVDVVRRWVHDAFSVVGFLMENSPLSVHPDCIMCSSIPHPPSSN